LKTVLANAEQGGPQVIAVTSGGPDEGKSVVAANLALAFAADTDGVLLIDADLRRPSIENWLDPAPNLGLTELLRGRTELEHAVLPLENSQLRILPAGNAPRDPVQLLSSPAAKRLMASLREKYTRIIIDTPPIVPFTDADAIGTECDGMIIVARSGVTRKEVFMQALESVTSTRILGTVLNDTSYNIADRKSYYDEGHYYEEYNRRSRR
jgi:capsular exopolysaccharide synthesis family protein